mmetsp:Transcript_37265/g.119518  ORF Transcript_37265/g.119518 Transcript_37265/m.119518 type:complete len:241 (-) Transcript_37265:221-943(-)
MTRLRPNCARTQSANPSDGRDEPEPRPEPAPWPGLGEGRLKPPSPPSPLLAPPTSTSGSVSRPVRPARLPLRPLPLSRVRCCRSSSRSCLSTRSSERSPPEVAMAHGSRYGNRSSSEPASSEGTSSAGWASSPPMFVPRKKPTPYARLISPKPCARVSSVVISRMAARAMPAFPLRHPATSRAATACGKLAERPSSTIETALLPRPRASTGSRPCTSERRPHTTAPARLETLKAEESSPE